MGWDALKSLSIRRRRTYRLAAQGTGTSVGALYRAFKRGDLNRRCSGLNPGLTEKNKLERLKFCLSFIDPKTRQFHGIYDRLHLDKKWFYLKEEKPNASLGPDEDMPYRNVQSKRFITKVMFLRADARPRFGTDGKVLLDGKVEFWGFTKG